MQLLLTSEQQKQSLHLASVKQHEIVIALALLASCDPEDQETQEWTDLCFRFLFSKEVVAEVLECRRIRKQKRDTATPTSISSDHILAYRGMLLNAVSQNAARRLILFFHGLLCRVLYFYNCYVS